LLGALFIVFLRRFILETVFDANLEVSAGYSTSESFGKNKRSTFIFITTHSDSNALASEDLRKIDAVKEVYLARGAYDIVAMVSGEFVDSVREIINSKISNLSSVKSTLTLTIV